LTPTANNRGAFWGTAQDNPRLFSLCILGFPHMGAVKYVQLWNIMISRGGLCRAKNYPHKSSCHVMGNYIKAPCQMQQQFCKRFRSPKSPNAFTCTILHW